MTEPFEQYEFDDNPGSFRVTEPKEKLRNVARYQRWVLVGLLAMVGLNILIL